MIVYLPHRCLVQLKPRDTTEPLHTGVIRTKVTYRRPLQLNLIKFGGL